MPMTFARIVPAVVLLLFGAGCCGGDKCQVEAIKKKLSPNAQFVAVSWLTSCGGSGLGSLEANVSIFRASEEFEIDENASGNVFWCGSAIAKTEWDGNGTLLIKTTDNCKSTSDVKALNEYLGVRIRHEYAIRRHPS